MTLSIEDFGRAYGLRIINANLFPQHVKVQAYDRATGKNKWSARYYTVYKHYAYRRFVGYYIMFRGKRSYIREVETQ